MIQYITVSVTSVRSLCSKLNICIYILYVTVFRQKGVRTFSLIFIDNILVQ